MQESNKPTNEEAFWKSPQESVEVGLEHLAEDKELEVSQVKAKFRHRLVGAAVLVAALATVLPIFLKSLLFKVTGTLRRRFLPSLKSLSTKWNFRLIIGRQCPCRLTKAH